MTRLCLRARERFQARGPCHWGRCRCRWPAARRRRPRPRVRARRQGRCSRQGDSGNRSASALLQARANGNAFRHGGEVWLAAFFAAGQQHSVRLQPAHLARRARFVMTMMRRPIRSSGVYHSAMPLKGSAACSPSARDRPRGAAACRLLECVRQTSTSRDAELDLDEVVDGDLRAKRRMGRR